MQVDKLVSKAASRMLSPSVSPATSPTLTHSGSPTPPLYTTQHKISGIPTVAGASRYTAPVHIDVGGAIYTSSLETLTKGWKDQKIYFTWSDRNLIFPFRSSLKDFSFHSGQGFPSWEAIRFPDSKLSRLFNGSIPIVLDSLKQHYFIDRDGKMFRHILNFMRHGKLILPDYFKEYDLLLEEAKFFELNELVRQIGEIRRMTNDSSSSWKLNGGIPPPNMNNSSISFKYRGLNGIKKEDDSLGYQAIALNIAPDLGERVMLSGERAVIEEVFPEVSQPMMDARTSLPWNHDPKFVIRFPLNGYCKFNSMQAIQRLLNLNFVLGASNGGGVEGQQFSEYLFYRKQLPL